MSNRQEQQVAREVESIHGLCYIPTRRDTFIQPLPGLGHSLQDRIGGQTSFASPTFSVDVLQSKSIGKFNVEQAARSVLAERVARKKGSWKGGARGEAQGKDQLRCAVKNLTCLHRVTERHNVLNYD
jgi:hypothetical protein